MSKITKKNPNPATPEVRHLTGALEFREAEQDGKTIRTIAGYAIKYESDSVVMRDWYGDEFVEQIAKDAFAESVRANRIKALWSHDASQVLGSTTNSTLRLTSDNTGLRFELDLPDTTVGRDAWESVKRGDVDGMSFGFRSKKDKWSREERGKDKRPLYRRTVLDGELFEVSPVAFPAYPETDVSCRSLDEYRARTQEAERERRKRKLVLEAEL
ncbi:MAG: HK97 family phage prohead protease [Kiritimatiellia bacterium]